MSLLFNKKTQFEKKINPALALVLGFFLLLILPGCGSDPGGMLPLDSIQSSLASETTYSVLLEDMKEEGSIIKTFYHNYLIVTPDESKPTGWMQVPESYYNENIDFLGMALVSKKDGVMDSQISPPGYQFVGDEKYGRWREDSHGGSFWEFYGKYAFFSSLFGGWYHPIYRSDYMSYGQHRAQGAPYYGRNKEFGSTGKIAQKKNPSFYSRRMEAVSSGKSSFKSNVNSRIGRTKTSSTRGRAGGFGK